MEEKYTIDQINLIVKQAQITAPSFSLEQYQGLMQSQGDFSETGFCEASWSVTQLHQKKNILYEKIVQAIDELLHQKIQLERAVDKLKLEQAQVQEANQQAQSTLQQTMTEIRETQKNCKILKNQQQKAEEGLLAFQQDAEKEKERLHQELESLREQNIVTQTDIDLARNLKAELQKQGVGLELALTLCTEFGKHENPSDKLGENLQKVGSFRKYLNSLSEWGESQKKAYQAQIQSLEGNCHKLETVLAQHDAIYRDRETKLFLQNHQINEKSDILSFYQSYRPLRALIDYLGKHPTGFYFCSWCGARYWILDSGYTLRNQNICLWCNMVKVEWDVKAYQALNLKPGVYKLLP
jgi:chromosome segregation ATPase